MDLDTDLEGWWHGSRDGLQPGSWLLPRNITGVPSIWPEPSIGRIGPSPSARFVYVSRNMNFAALHATFHPCGGALYLVQPVEPIEPDPEALRDCEAATEWSFRCPRALILAQLDLSADHLVALAHSRDFLRHYGITR